jgi:hypothetical protein
MGEPLESFVETGAMIKVLFRAVPALTVPSMNRRESLGRCHPGASGPKRQFYAKPTAVFRNADTRHK